MFNELQDNDISRHISLMMKMTKLSTFKFLFY